MSRPAVDIGSTNISGTINNSLPQAVPAASANPMQIILFFAACIWIAGMAVMFIYSAVSYLRLNYRISTATLLQDNVYETDEINSPFVCGFFKPKIYLPVGLDDKEREYVLRHERTHIRRVDHLIKPFAFLVLSVHWFNPFMWLSFWLMSRDLEMSCDERVVRELGAGEKAAYSAALVHLAMKRPILAGSPLAFGESGTKTRVKNILNYKKPAFWVIFIALAAAITAGVCLLTNPEVSPLPNANEVQLSEIEQPNESSGPDLSGGDTFFATYVFNKCLYMNPLSSYYPFKSTGCLYVIGENSFTVIDEKTGEILEIISLIEWNEQQISDQEWAAMFEIDIGVPDISGISSSSRIMYVLSDKYRLFKMGDEIWLVQMQSNRDRIWSVYQISKRSTKFSDEEIDAAITSVKKKFAAEFKGCELINLWYDEAESDKRIPSYLYGALRDNAIILLSDFYVQPNGGDGSLEPDYTYNNWMWILIRDDRSSKWRVDDWGY